MICLGKLLNKEQANKATTMIFREEKKSESKVTTIYDIKYLVFNKKL